MRNKWSSILRETFTPVIYRNKETVISTPTRIVRRLRTILLTKT